MNSSSTSDYRYSEKESRCGRLGKLIFSAIQHVNNEDGWTPKEIAHCLKKFHKLSANEDSLVNAVKMCLKKKTCQQFLEKNDQNGKYYFILSHPTRSYCFSPRSPHSIPVAGAKLSFFERQGSSNGMTVLTRTPTTVPLTHCKTFGGAKDAVPYNRTISAKRGNNGSTKAQNMKKGRGPVQKEYTVKQTQTDLERVNKSTSPRYVSVGTMKATSPVSSPVRQLNSGERSYRYNYDVLGYKNLLSNPSSSKQPIVGIGSKSGMQPALPIKKLRPAIKSRKMSKKKEKTIFLKVKKAGRKSRYRQLQALVDNYCQIEKHRKSRRIMNQPKNGRHIKSKSKKANKVKSKPAILKSRANKDRTKKQENKKKK